MRDPGKGGVFAKSRRRRKIYSFLCLFGFSMELISVLLINGWYSTRSPSPRGREEEKKGVENKNKQVLPSPINSGEIGLCHTHTVSTLVYKHIHCQRERKLIITLTTTKLTNGIHHLGTVHHHRQ